MIHERKKNQKLDFIKIKNIFSAKARLENKETIHRQEKKSLQNIDLIKNWY